MDASGAPRTFLCAARGSQAGSCSSLPTIIALCLFPCLPSRWPRIHDLNYDSTLSTIRTVTCTNLMPPASTLSRHSRPSSPPISSHTTTPARTKHLYPITSAQTSTTSSPTITAGGQQQKLNVVTRVAIEGWAKQGEDGAGIKMYLKV